MKLKNKKWLLISAIAFLLLVLLFIVPKTRDKMSSATNSSLNNINSSFGSVAPVNAGSNMANTEKTTNEGSASNVQDNTTKSTEDTKVKALERMVVYEATLSIRVKDFNKTQTSLEQIIKEKGGYIVSSESNGTEGNYISGDMVIRIPQEHFEEFLNDVEKTSTKVLDRQVKGTDVTEEYVDLESRLKSKRVVEARMTDFMNKANSTEELLRISGDLAKVQEEIETTMGRMQYLKNTSSLSSVKIQYSEERVITPEVKPKVLTTWDKTKNQFKASVQVLLGFLSTLIIFFVGDSPIIILAILCGIFVALLFKWRKKKKNKE